MCCGQIKNDLGIVLVGAGLILCVLIEAQVLNYCLIQKSYYVKKHTQSSSYAITILNIVHLIWCSLDRSTHSHLTLTRVIVLLPGWLLTPLNGWAEVYRA